MSTQFPPQVGGKRFKTEKVREIAATAQQFSEYLLSECDRLQSRFSCELCFFQAALTVAFTHSFIISSQERARESLLQGRSPQYVKQMVVHSSV